MNRRRYHDYLDMSQMAAMSLKHHPSARNSEFTDQLRGNRWRLSSRHAGLAAARRRQVDGFCLYRSARLSVFSRRHARFQQCHESRPRRPWDLSEDSLSVDLGAFALRLKLPCSTARTSSGAVGNSQHETMDFAVMELHIGRAQAYPV
jgi:hypothetical protein